MFCRKIYILTVDAFYNQVIGGEEAEAIGQRQAPMR